MLLSWKLHKRLIRTNVFPREQICSCYVTQEHDVVAPETFVVNIPWREELSHPLYSETTSLLILSLSICSFCLYVCVCVCVCFTYLFI